MPPLPPPPPPPSSALPGPAAPPGRRTRPAASFPVPTAPLSSVLSGPLLGLDPGTHRLGWGLIERQGLALRLADCGVFRAPARQALPERLRDLFAELEALISRQRPAAAALEETFAGANPQSALAMGEGRGMVLLALARAGIPVLEISPAEIKKAVSGHGNASKALVARMVCARLNLATTPSPPDITDALAAAIALAHRLPG